MSAFSVFFCLLLLLLFKLVLYSCSELFFSEQEITSKIKKALELSENGKEEINALALYMISCAVTIFIASMMYSIVISYLFR